MTPKRTVGWRLLYVGVWWKGSVGNLENLLDSGSHGSVPRCWRPTMPPEGMEMVMVTSGGWEEEQGRNEA